MTYIRKIVNRRVIRHRDICRSDTDNGAGIWCDRVGKYVKPAGQIDGITMEEAQYPVGRPKYIITPVGLGSLDS